MASHHMLKKLRRTALSAALGFTLISGAAFAQSSAGSIYGEATSGATVTIKNLDTGTSRELAADQDGRFTFSQLPTGRYSVTADGTTREVTVSVGTGTRVSLTGDAAEMEAIEVTGSAINPIDVSSVESTTVFSQEQIQRLPVGRDITNVALLAPGTVRGDTGFGNLASFGGSSVAENGYYINGFDVTNIRNFTSYASMPFDAIGEQQIKTGGYGAEFGRSLGGVISLVTKRGTNDWHAGVSVYWSPEDLRDEGQDVLSRDAGAVADGYTLFQYRSNDETDNLNYNVYGGGPLLRDRLFFFGLIEGQDYSRELFNDNDSSTEDNTDPTGLLKLDWYITDNHLLEFTGISNETEASFRTYSSDVLYPDRHYTLTDDYEVRNGGEVYIGKYTGYLTDNFTLSVLAGKIDHTASFRTVPADGADCPAAYDSRVAGTLIHIGCWNENAFTVRDATWGPDKDEREAYRIDGEWMLGDHTLRFGYDDETFTSGHAGQTYSGGIYYRYFTTGASGRVNRTNVPAGTPYVRVRHFQSSSSEYEVLNTAAYVEDNWQVTDNWLLYGGVRMETFENRNGDGDPFVESDNLFAPRLGFAWDVHGDSSVKVFGNAGRYYIPIASNSNIRASGVEVTTETFHTYTGIDPVTGAAIGLGPQIGAENVNGSLIAPDPSTVAATNLKPMYQDEYILGAQWALDERWSMGLRGIWREVKNGMDDYCSHQPFLDFAEDNGFDEFDPDSMAGCFFINPGRDVEIGLDLDNDGDYEVTTVPASYLGLPDYERKYRAIEVFWERSFNEDWYVQGSYTYSRSYGNVEGYVNSTLEQADAGLTQDFDHRLFEDGSYGYLPNDRRHTIKAFGVYQLADEWRLSANALLQSGRPVNCNGFIPLEGTGIDEGNLNFYSASSFYCLNEQGESVLGTRGDRGRTPWTYTFDLGAAYQPNWADGRLELKVDVFNIFNASRVTEYFETGERTRSSPEPHPNYLNDVNYQTPRSVRFTARYEW